MMAILAITSFQHNEGFVPVKIMYESGKLVVLDETGKRVRVYFDLDVVDERDLVMQGNPRIVDGWADVDYWADSDG